MIPPHDVNGSDLASVLLKIIGINPLQRDGSRCRHTDIVLDHQIGEAGPVNQDYLLRDQMRVFRRRGRKIARRDKDSLIRLLAGESTDETLNLLSTDGVLPSLRLDVNHIETKSIFVNDAVNSLVV